MASVGSSTPSTFTPITRRYWARPTSRMEYGCWVVGTPALRWAKSIEPYSSRTSARRRSQASASDTSSTAAVPSISSATARTPTSVRSMATTWAPRDASRRALAAPIPEAAPVTSATLSSRSPMSVCADGRVALPRIVEVDHLHRRRVLLDRTEHQLPEHRLRDDALRALRPGDLESQGEATGGGVPVGGGDVGTVGTEEDAHRVEARVQAGGGSRQAHARSVASVLRRDQVRNRTTGRRASGATRHQERSERYRRSPRASGSDPTSGA